MVRLSYHQISFFPRSYSYYNRYKRFELIKLLENQELLNECGIYFCTGIYFFKLASSLHNTSISQSFHQVCYRRCLIAETFPSEATTATSQCLSRTLLFVKHKMHISNTNISVHYFLNTL